VKALYRRFPQVQSARCDINDISPRQSDSRYASSISICESLLAFTACIGYPKALTALFGQGFE
jgi:hypothetical protein